MWKNMSFKKKYKPGDVINGNVVSAVGDNFIRFKNEDGEYGFSDVTLNIVLNVDFRRYEPGDKFEGKYQTHIINEVGKDYFIFQDKDGFRYVCLDSGNVPKSFFDELSRGNKPDPTWEDDYEKDFIDLRNEDKKINDRSYSRREAEMFKKPIMFPHFKRRIILITERSKIGSDEFYNYMKYKVMNLIPTVNTELVAQINNFLIKKFGVKEYKNIIKRCAKWMNQILEM